MTATVGVAEEPVERGDATRSLAGRLRARLTPAWLGRTALRLLVPTLLFGRFQRFAYLRPTNAARMLVGDDWTTYLVSPNYLRSAPLLSFPIARVPGYAAPVGASLSKTDSVPLLMPVYRALLVLFPGRPIQLVGWLLLAGTVGTFVAVARFCDRVRTDLRGPGREAATLALATVAVVAPFWTIQYVHPALMQHWILVWALTGALARCPTFLGGRFEPATGRWTGLGPILAAAAVQPYLLPMVALVALAPDVAGLRRRPREVLTKAAVAGVAAVLVAVVLGYLGGSGKLGSTGFGDYAADLGTVLDPDARSRFVNDLPGTPGSVGGYGYLGLGGALLAAAGLAAVVRDRRRARLAALVGHAGPPEATDRWPARWLGIAVALVTTYAVLPVVRLFGRPVLHLQRLTDPASSLTALFRVNGRFVWMLLWLSLLVGAARVLRARRRAVVAAVAAGALVLQVADVVPWPPLLRPVESVEYAAALDGLRAQRDAGATTVRFEPPVVIPGCYPAAHGTFADLGDALLAAAVLELPVNSGYTARLEPAYVERICRDDAEAFAAGRFDAAAVYLLPAAAPTPDGLRCIPLTTRLNACRTTGS